MQFYISWICFLPPCTQVYVQNRNCAVASSNLKLSCDSTVKTVCYKLPKHSASAYPNATQVAVTATESETEREREKVSEQFAVCLAVHTNCRGMRAKARGGLRQRWVLLFEVGSARSFVCCFDATFRACITHTPRLPLWLLRLCVHKWS